jgi:hypothetical protein
MTISDPRDRAAPSDPRVDAAWRALSSEVPPKALDAAIMAAARREVRARPQKIGAREAMADHRRWWPLAAAATVAAIAVGVLQLTTPDQISAPALDKNIVTDVPAPASRPAAERPATPSRPEETKPDAGNAFRAEQAPTRADAPRRQAPAPELPLTAKRESAAGSVPPMAEPFPAAPPKSAAATAAAPADAGPIAAPAPAPQPATAGPIAAPAPPPQPLSAGSPQSVRESAATRPAPLAKTAADRAADAGADEARTKDRRALPVADWIALIRRLRDEGKSAEALKELAAFRVAHADHEKLLPPDLREWQPPEK